ncbi:hypothetical protein CspHIS471_0506610 [Cutaneotrichosporon sp. HIS471]|nr:hypothetical protein CspHIS471_0506610 [Cutaneotrichosporon sp. HIS471]
MMGDDVDVDMSPPGSPRRRRTCPPTANAYSVAPPLSSSSRRTPYPPPTLALSPPTPQALGRSLTRVSYDKSHIKSNHLGRHEYQLDCPTESFGVHTPALVTLSTLNFPTVPFNSYTSP